MDKYAGRQKDLSQKLNSYLNTIVGSDIDYYSKLTSNQILGLKTALSGIHNLLTLKMTLAAADWLMKFFTTLSFDKDKVLADIDLVKPNASGFDIYLPEHKIIGEVKCTIPVNSGGKYGSAQWTSILNDVVNLLEGKKPVKDPKSYYKFLFLLDIGKTTEDAINDLIRAPTSAKKDSKHYKRHQKRNDLVLLKPSDKYNKLTTDKVFIVKIKLDN